MDDYHLDRKKTNRCPPPPKSGPQGDCDSHTIDLESCFSFLVSQVYFLPHCVIYFPIISYSRLTADHISRAPRLVICWVIGISHTLHQPLFTSTTVRLTPLITILHLGMINGSKRSSKAILTLNEPSSWVRRSVTVPVVSICPVTTWPSSLSHICIPSSILHRSQTCLDHNVVRSRLSCIAKKPYLSSSIISTVIHAPSCETLCQIRNTTSSGLLNTKCPPSLSNISTWCVTIPVNIRISSYK